jgi:hypothetical protein
VSERRALLDSAAFLDSLRGEPVGGAATADVRTIVQRFLAACYEDLGKAPRLVDGDELASLLTEILPRRFGVRDPLAAAAEDVLAAYLAFLNETEVVPAAYEQRRALDEHAAAFRELVASGAAHGDGTALTGKGRTIASRGEKVGRNDPCPCGSGKKFKKCCQRLGS